MPAKVFRFIGVVCLLALVAAEHFFAQEQVDTDIQWRIRREATDNSQLMRTLQVLTDVYGPRLTGSPNLKAASEWVVKETTAWGLKNAHLEPWTFGHPGWLNERLSVHVVSPVKDALVVEAVSWTPGTSGPVTAQTVAVELPTRPTQAELTAFFDAERSKVKGKIVLVGTPAVVGVTIFRRPSGARTRTCVRNSRARADRHLPARRARRRLLRRAC